MDQADLEAQSQTRKLRRGRHSSSSNWPNWVSRLPTDGTTASADSYWKVGSRPAHSVSHNHEQRKHEYGVTEPVTNCYSASNTYRPRPRTSSKPSPDQTYRASQQGSRTARNKLLTTNNIAVVRKPCYKDEPEEEEDDVKYAEEEVNYAEENVDDEVAEEVDEDQEEAFEYNEKDYEELQEADDEVDDESDAFQTQLHRAQHKVQKASNHRVQNMRHPEQQQELRRIHRPQNPLKMYQDQKLSSSRFYSHGPDLHHETSYGDAAEVINSEEEHTPPQTPPRRSSRRIPETHHAIPDWVPARKSFDRNRERLGAAPLINSQHHQRQQRLPHHQNLEQQQQQQHHHHHHQQPRRSHRSAKPEIESLMLPQPSTTGTKKCCICGGSTAPVKMRVGSPMKGSCRLHEYRGLSVKGPRGEDGEAEEQVVCPRCVKRHNMEDLRSSCDAASSPEAVPLYPGKPHRPKVHRPSTYECPEENLTVDEMLASYASNGQARASGLDYSTTPRERTRHSVQTARSPLRRGSYYER